MPAGALSELGTQLLDMNLAAGRCVVCDILNSCLFVATVYCSSVCFVFFLGFFKEHLRAVKSMSI